MFLGIEISCKTLGKMVLNLQDLNADFIIQEITSIN